MNRANQKRLLEIEQRARQKQTDWIKLLTGEELQLIVGEQTDAERAYWASLTDEQLERIVEAGVRPHE